MIDSINDYLEYEIALGKSPATITSYNERLRKFRLFARKMEITSIRNLSSKLAQAYHDHLIKNNLKPSTREAYMVTLKQFLRWAYRHRLILTDLSKSIELPGKPETLPPLPLTEDSIKQFIANLPSDHIWDLRNKAIVEIMYACGLRRLEVINLNICDIDFNKGIVTVKGKGNKERLVPVHERALKSIAGYLHSRGGRPVRDSPLFVTHNSPRQNSRRMTTTAVDRVFARLRRYSDRHIHPHLLRHTFALHLLQNGVDVRYVQLLLGHSSPDTTSRYLNLCKTEIKRCYDLAIERIMSEN